MRYTQTKGLQQKNQRTIFILNTTVVSNYINIMKNIFNLSFDSEPAFYRITN